MIVSQPNSGGVVVSSTGDSGIQLRMKATGKAFKAVIDTIYKDKIGSIVRELSTNALDAHRVVGVESRPFEIHVPSIYEPYFSIRDYGCSMTHDQIINVYSILFESSKDTSNDQVGGFGLGGKNFLSYQDSGTIITYLDGAKRNYVLMYDENEMPNVHFMGEETTTEENGLYIEIAVKSTDCNLFKEAIRRELRWLKVKPVLHNVDTDFTIPTLSIKETYGNFGVFESSYFGYNNSINGFWAIQGEIGYKIDLAELTKHFTNKNAIKFFQAFKNGVMNFDIGEIHVTLSREDIQYDKHTIKSIERFIDEHAPLISKEFLTKLDSIESNWDKMAYINSNTTFNVLSKLTQYNLPKNDAKIEYVNDHFLINIDFITELKSPLHLCQFNGIKRNYFSKGKSGLIKPEMNVVFLIRDIGKKAISKVKWYIENNPSKTVYMLEYISGYEGFADYDISSIEDKLGGLKINRVSDLPDAPKNSKVVKGTPIVYEKEQYDSVDSISKWNRIYDEEEIENGYYIVFERYPHPEYKKSTQSINRFISNCKENKKEIKIYAIKNTKVDLFKDNPNFIELNQAVDDWITSIKDKYESSVFIKRYASALLINNEIDQSLSPTRIFHLSNKDRSSINKGHFIYDSLRIKKIVSKYISRISSNIIDKMNMSEKELFDLVIGNHTKISDNLNNIFKKYHKDSEIILNRYPHLEWLYYTHYYDSTKLSSMILSYINMIERLHEIDNNPMV